MQGGHTQAGAHAPWSSHWAGRGESREGDGGPGRWVTCRGGSEKGAGQGPEPVHGSSPSHRAPWSRSVCPPQGQPYQDVPGTRAVAWAPWEKRAPAPTRPGSGEPPGGRDVHPDPAPLRPARHAQAQAQARAAPLKTCCALPPPFSRASSAADALPLPAPAGSSLTSPRADFGPAPAPRVRPTHWLRPRIT